MVRPEDIEITSAEKGMLKGEVITSTFKGVHYEMIVKENGRLWMIHSTEMACGSYIGMNIGPDLIHIMERVVSYEIKSKILAYPYIIWLIIL